MIREYIIKISDEVMENELADSPKELVRCKDCKRRGSYDCPVYVGGDEMCSEPDDWYCADGERKE